MVPPLVLVDLDDTLFQSARKSPPAEAKHLTLAAEAANGHHSYATRAQTNLFRWLSETAEVVPVTARGSGAFARVRLPFRNGAVLANGAVVLLPDRKVDAAWRAEVARGLTDARSDLDLLLNRGRQIALEAGLQLRSWIVEEDGIGAYTVFKDNIDENGAGLAILADALAPPAGWSVHRNSNNMAYIPACISKRLACERLVTGARRSDPGRLVVGIGDSVSDFGFMALCDLIATPSRGQLAELFAVIYAEKDAKPGSVHRLTARLNDPSSAL
ncbi:hypothetical protein [Methylobacterium sp. 37f]|uniref:hypothetical protein n=1 Tax=Methylobacterium sp. 37f TaxID=2817058 RepID=UPI001FFD08D9|nr:hypothetical protein [Methylobacterium sp. 37f]MCK2055274.1 hypothetical protein [Methylobacterium sp. 37f]